MGVMSAYLWITKSRGGKYKNSNFQLRALKVGVFIFPAPAFCSIPTPYVRTLSDIVPHIL